MNAIKHGLTAEQVVIENENKEEFETLLSDIIEQLAPKGPLEEQLVIRITVSLWRLRRSYRIEAEILEFERRRQLYDAAKQTSESLAARASKIFDRSMEPVFPETKNIEKELKIESQEKKENRAEVTFIDNFGSSASAFLLGTSGSDPIGKLVRYEGAHERSLMRALHELQRLQAARAGEQNPAPVAVDVILDASD